jgi:hypothetical protein
MGRLAHQIKDKQQRARSLCPNSTILEGFSTKCGVERDGIYFCNEGRKRKAGKG